MDPIYAELLAELGIVIHANSIQKTAPKEWENPNVSEYSKNLVMKYEWDAKYRCKLLKYIPYKRINYFSEHLNRLQCCEKFELPSTLSLTECTVDISDPRAYFHMREWLRHTLKHQKTRLYCYEHIFQLLRQCGGRRLVLNYEKQRRLKRHFILWDLEYQRQGYTRNFSHFILLSQLLELHDIKPPYDLPTVHDPTKYMDFITIFKKVNQHVNLAQLDYDILNYGSY